MYIHMYLSVCVYVPSEIWLYIQQLSWLHNPDSTQKSACSEKNGIMPLNLFHDEQWAQNEVEFIVLNAWVSNLEVFLFM